MSAPQAIVHVVDDDPSFRTAITRLLRAGGYSYRAFSCSAEYLNAAAAEIPGCIITDLHMPGASGLELQKAVSQTENPLPIVFLTGHGDIPTSVQAMRRGAEDFLTKPVKKDELFAAIERAFARDRRERELRAKKRADSRRFAVLTPREREVLTFVVRGQLNKQIAGNLEASERTIKAHRANIMAKLGVQSVAELVRLCHEMGL